MRQIGTVAGEQEVKRFADHLVTCGIKTQIEHGAQGWAVWVFDEDRVADARRELAEFQQNPADARYAAAAAQAETLRTQAARRDASAKSNVVDMKSRWAEPANRNWPVTFVLMAASIWVAVVTDRGESNEVLMRRLMISTQGAAPFETQGNQNSVIALLLSNLPEIHHGEVWRLITPIFLHFGTMHIVFNMLFMYSIARYVEMRCGSLRFICLVFVSAVVSNLVQFEYDVFRRHWGSNGGGMSGVGYALFGYLWMKSRFDPSSGMILPSNTVVWLIGWLFLCMTGWLGPIANAAHVGGLVTGMILGYVPIAFRRR